MYFVPHQSTITFYYSSNFHAPNIPEKVLLPYRIPYDSAPYTMFEHMCPALACPVFFCLC